MSHITPEQWREFMDLITRLGLNWLKNGSPYRSVAELGHDCINQVESTIETGGMGS